MNRGEDAHTDGLFTLSEQARGQVSRAQLDSADVFFVDLGHTVFVWVGSGASPAERSKALPYAAAFLKAEQRSPSTPVVRVSEGSETQMLLDALKA